MRNKSTFSVFFSILTAGAGMSLGVDLGGFADLTQLVLLLHQYSFSRDQEREADALGVQFIAKSGLHPMEASRIWKAMIEEQEASKVSAPKIFFATHPSPKERVDTLSALASRIVQKSSNLTVGKERFLKVTLPLRHGFLRDELRRRDFVGTQVLLSRLFKSGVGQGDLHFYQGELYRLRAKDGDADKAIKSYRAALKFEDAPPETYRGLGLVMLKAGRKEETRRAFEAYIRLKANAEDAMMIKAYLLKLQ